MKNLILTFIYSFIFSSFIVSSATTPFKPDVKGVWANATSELVQTDSVMIYFTRNDSLNLKSATLVIPICNINRTTIFTPDTILMTAGEPIDIKMEDETIIVNGSPMFLVEKINNVKPYPQLEATPSNIAKCLQQWQLGTRVALDENGEACQIMIDTNNHSFMYMVTPEMSYIRAASLRHTDKGSVFLQNIRMMKNMQTGEYTHYSAPDNYTLLMNLPDIDHSKFSPNSCTFADEGIYWSFVSCKPKHIILNGCGEQYNYYPAEENEYIIEWFEFKPQPKWFDTISPISSQFISY